MTPYIDHYRSAPVPYVNAAGKTASRLERVCTHVWADHFRRLFTWHYGPERADAIMSGRDPSTQADIARWNRLGRRSAA